MNMQAKAEEQCQIEAPERWEGCYTAWMRCESLIASLQQQVGGLQADFMSAHLVWRKMEAHGP